jgi:hypothetical protein
MYLVPLKTLLVEAMKVTFDGDYIVEDFRDLAVSIEYPVAEESYPGVWVDFQSTGQLEIAGVDHREYAEPAGLTGNTRRYSRWKFQGYALFTIVALTSLERDRLFDEMVRVMAFGREAAQTSEFRNTIEDNDLIACNFDFDQIGVQGTNSSPGTPWGTDEIIYETTVSMECLGEFVSDGSTGTLVPLSTLRVVPYVQGTPDPTLAEPDAAGWI